MKKLVIAATALLISTQALGYDIKRASFGCIYENTYRTLTGYSATGDQALFQKTLWAEVSRGYCIMFDKGTEVFIEDNSGTLLQVRPKGKAAKYWTSVRTVL